MVTFPEDSPHSPANDTVNWKWTHSSWHADSHTEQNVHPNLGNRIWRFKAGIFIYKARYFYSHASLRLAFPLWKKLTFSQVCWMTAWSMNKL